MAKELTEYNIITSPYNSILVRRAFDEWLKIHQEDEERDLDACITFILLDLSKENEFKHCIDTDLQIGKQNTLQCLLNGLNPEDPLDQDLAKLCNQQILYLAEPINLFSGSSRQAIAQFLYSDELKSLKDQQKIRASCWGLSICCALTTGAIAALAIEHPSSLDWVDTPALIATFALVSLVSALIAISSKLNKLNSDELQKLKQLAAPNEDGTAEFIENDVSMQTSYFSP